MTKKEELKQLKEEYAELSKKLSQLSEEEIAEVTGGVMLANIDEAIGEQETKGTFSVGYGHLEDK